MLNDSDSYEKVYGTTRGAVYNKPAYLLSKNLDHSGWGTLLPRKITPSDVDCVFDNYMAAILVELNSHLTQWVDLDTGQTWTYQGLIHKHMKRVAVLATHSVRPEVKDFIDTVQDVESFQVMLWDDGFKVSEVFHGNDRWQKFVVGWYAPNGPEKLRTFLASKGLEHIA